MYKFACFSERCSLVARNGGCFEGCWGEGAIVGWGNSARGGGGVKVGGQQWGGASTSKNQPSHQISVSKTA